MKLKLKKTLFFIIFLFFSLQTPLINAQSTLTDSYLNEDYIETYNQIFVNTTAGEYLLAKDIIECEPSAFNNSFSMWLNGTNYVISDNSLPIGHNKSRAVSFWYMLANGETTTNYEYIDTGFMWLFKQGLNDNQLYVSNGTHGFRFRGFTMTTDGDFHHKVLNIGYDGSLQPSFIEEYQDNVLVQNRTSFDYNQSQAIDLYIEIGRSSNTGGINANFTIDNFEIYDRFLTTTEIDYNYANGCGVDHIYNNTEQLVYYGFNDLPNNSTVHDRLHYNNASVVFYANDTLEQAGHVPIDFYDSGTLYSSNLVDGLNSTEILEFETQVLFCCGNGSASIQFSEDNSTWYASNGALNQWDNLNNGTNTLNLRNLGFHGNIFYRTNLNTTYVCYSPEVYYMTLTYEGSMTELALIYLVFALIMGMTLTGLLGLFKPIISLATIGITLLTVLPQLASLDNFLISFAVGSLFFQCTFLALGYARNR